MKLWPKYKTARVRTVGAHAHDVVLINSDPRYDPLYIVGTYSKRFARLVVDCLKDRITAEREAAGIAASDAREVERSRTYCSRGGLLP